MTLNVTLRLQLKRPVLAPPRPPTHITWVAGKDRRSCCCPACHEKLVQCIT